MTHVKYSQYFLNQRPKCPKNGKTTQWKRLKCEEACGAALLKGSLGSFCFSSLPAPSAHAESACLHPLKRSLSSTVHRILGIFSGLLVSVRTGLASVLYAQLLWTKNTVKNSAEGQEHLSGDKYIRQHTTTCACASLF